MTAWASAADQQKSSSMGILETSPRAATHGLERARLSPAHERIHEPKNCPARSLRVSYCPPERPVNTTTPVDGRGGVRVRRPVQRRSRSATLPAGIVKNCGVEASSLSSGALPGGVDGARAAGRPGRFASLGNGMCMIQFQYIHDPCQVDLLTSGTDCRPAPMAGHGGRARRS